MHAIKTSGQANEIPPKNIWHFLLSIACLALGTAVFQWFVVGFESSFRKVHPTEQHIADYIRALGGVCAIDRSNKRHIVGVGFHDTKATDDDVAVVMQLPYLSSLDVSDSLITEASLRTMFADNRIKELRIVGSGITEDELNTFLQKSQRGVYLLK